MSKHSFLFLQGIASPFFHKLGTALEARGHSVKHINFCGGDQLFWPGSKDWDYPDSIDSLPEFIQERFSQHAFSDVVLFGDCRPIHLAAIPIARAHCATIHVFEEGYLRPNWVTLERDGVNGFTALPKDPEWYREAHKRLPPISDERPANYDMVLRGLYDIAYHIGSLLLSFRYPGYRHHRPNPVYMEYIGWFRRLCAQPFYISHINRLRQSLTANGTPYFLLPLQLDSDSQLEVHSSFDSISEMIEEVMLSFAHHAPQKSMLVIKRHPLDPASISYAKLIRKLSKSLNLDGRVEFIDGGDLLWLIDHAAGVVTINSTVGFTALTRGKPLIVLGEAVYDVPELTYQGQLDSFWNDPPSPDEKLFKQFRDLVIYATQINGNLYSNSGIEMVIASAIERIEANQSLLDQVSGP